MNAKVNTESKKLLTVLFEVCSRGRNSVTHLTPDLAPAISWLKDYVHACLKKQIWQNCPISVFTKPDVDFWIINVDSEEISTVIVMQQMDRMDRN